MLGYSYTRNMEPQHWESFRPLQEGLILCTADQDNGPAPYLPLRACAKIVFRAPPLSCKRHAQSCFHVCLYYMCKDIHTHTYRPRCKTCVYICTHTQQLSTHTVCKMSATLPVQNYQSQHHSCFSTIRKYLN